MADTTERVRKYLRDIPQLNTLESVKQFSDEEIETAISEAIEDAEWGVLPAIRMNWDQTTTTIPFPILKIGVVCQLLSSLILWSSRNTISFSDSGGVNAQLWAQYQRDLPLLQGLFQPQWISKISALKMKKNITDFYGGCPSEYSNYES